jgi:hypothetical protein
MEEWFPEECFLSWKFALYKKNALIFWRDSFSKHEQFIFDYDTCSVLSCFCGSYFQILIDWLSTKSVWNFNERNNRGIILWMNRLDKFTFSSPYIFHSNMKGQVAVRPFFCPKIFLKRITYSESASNSE